MASGYRHNPIIDSQRGRCPICNQVSYSRAGVHPQCMINQADAQETRRQREPVAGADSPSVTAPVGADIVPQATASSS